MLKDLCAFCDPLGSMTEAKILIWDMDRIPSCRLLSSAIVILELTNSN
jgi:hypothetical protein